MGRLLALAAAAPAAAAAAGWRRLWRAPLPRTSGTVSVEGIEAPVRIERDARGVVRVEAESWVDACFGQGYATAQDRLWQLELTRRAGCGRLSELLGPEALDTDRMMRTLTLRRSAEREAAALEGEERAWYEAYSAGVDAAVAHARVLPFELQLLGARRPEPWTPADSLTVGRLIALGFSTNMESELFRAELVRLVGPELAERLECRYPEGNPVVTDPGTPWSGDALAFAEQLARAREAIGLGVQPAGSNNWAVAGHRSATGAPLLAGDPHITTSIPDIWHTVELHVGEAWTRGGAMPGLPGVVVGQNRHVAWSFTNAMADVQDLYVERVREPANGGPPEYEHDGGWRPVEVRVEEIRVRGRSEPARLEIRETHHGPIVTGVLGASAPEPLALCWTALRLPFTSPMRVTAPDPRSGPELVECLAGYCVPPMNLVWADASSIGYKLVGRIPRRPGGMPDLPKPGWLAEHDWDGYVPFDEMPEIVDPPGGVIVTANNRIAPADYPHHITSEYLDGYRAARIGQLLAERERHTLDDLARIQADIVSIPGLETARRLAALEPRDAREADALERVRGWDGRLDAATVAGTICSVFTLELGRLAAEAAIGDAAHAQRWLSKSLLGFTPWVSAPWRFHSRLLELWAEADPALVGGRSWDDLVRAALAAALDRLARDHGPDPDGWRWGQVHGVSFAHALGQGAGVPARALGRLLDRRLPAGGSPDTVNANGYAAHGDDLAGRWAASFRLLCDVADPGRSRWQHMTGQSGHPGSQHYDDLLEDWLAGRSHPFGQPAVSTLDLTP